MSDRHTVTQAQIVIDVEPIAGTDHLFEVIRNDVWIGRVWWLRHSGAFRIVRGWMTPHETPLVLDALAVATKGSAMAPSTPAAQAPPLPRIFAPVLAKPEQIIPTADLRDLREWEANEIGAPSNERFSTEASR